MGYPKEVFDKAWTIMEARKQEARDRTVARREEIYSTLPAVREIDRKMAATANDIIRAVAADPDRAPQRIEELRDANLALQERRQALLGAKGYPPDYLAEQHHCPDCKDTGYIGIQMCRCLGELLKAEAASLLGFSLGNAGGFSSFRLDFYPASAVDSSGVVPLERMEQIYRYCQHYADGFSPASESILMLGHTGLGKTHLSTAIAATASDKGYGVVYSPVQKLMDKLEAEKFSRNTAQNDRRGSNMDMVLDCDLLVLDDLGAEFVTQFTSAALYNIINTRIVEERPTIISSNLDIGKMEEKYSQRVVSRLLGGYKVLKFCGKDIRFIKKQAVNGA